MKPYRYLQLLKKEGIFSNRTGNWKKKLNNYYNYDYQIQKIQKQLRVSMYNPDYLMCRNIMKKHYETAKPQNPENPEKID
jgi:hypothetical protein